MEFNLHPNLEGRHAFLGASSYHWLNYDEDKLISSYTNNLAKQLGTENHEFAALCIKRGQKLPSVHKTLNMYVNDSVSFKMTPEQPLYFSENCFGTTDAISFRKNFLRIHDYKSGETPASMHQLEIYEALFCLEYHVDPEKIQSELRIYQSNQIVVSNPDGAYIRDIMNKIIKFDKILEQIKKEVN